MPSVYFFHYTVDISALFISRFFSASVLVNSSGKDKKLSSMHN